MLLSSFFFHCSCAHRYLHSFPTRRSSDLDARAIFQSASYPRSISAWARDGSSPRTFSRWTREAGSDSPLIRDRKSTRLNSSHRTISYAVFCLKKKKKTKEQKRREN